MINDEKVQLLQKIAHVTDDYNDVYSDIDALAQAGKIEVLYQTALALEEDAAALLHSIEQQWAREENADTLRERTSMGGDQQQLARGTIISIYYHIEEVLSSIPGLPAVETLLKLSELQREATAYVPLTDAVRLARSCLLASRLASRQAPSVLLEVFERYIHDEQQRELLSCLMQEMVIRGQPLESIPVIQLLYHLLQEQQHPLAWLPLTLTSIETGFILPQYNAMGEVYDLSFTGNDTGSVSTTEVKETRTSFIERSSDTRSSRIRTAVLNREQESNGRSEVRMFEAGYPLIEAISPAILLSLPLICLEGASFSDLYVGELLPAQVFTHLFAAAASGGAYNSGHKGAWGRLEAWQSLSGLVGADEQASYEEILEQVQHCQWYAFEAKSAWFYSVAWDLGLIAVGPDRKSLAVLAATDTD